MHFLSNDSLCWAIEHKYTDIAALLLLYRFDPNNTSSSGKSPVEIDPKILAAAVELAKDKANLLLVSPTLAGQSPEGRPSMSDLLSKHGSLRASRRASSTDSQPGMYGTTTEKRSCVVS